MTGPFHDVSAAILAGGLGTRLRAAVPDRPKVLAPVGGRPFLTHLLDRLAGAGVREVVLLTGHAADQVHAALGDDYAGMRLLYSVEPAPFGTAGAVRRALPHLRAETVLLLNGDSYCDVDLGAFRAFHAEKPGGASLALAHVADASRFGRVEVADDGRVTRFAEKAPAGPPGWDNAGSYLFPRLFLECVGPARAASLERDVFPPGRRRAAYAASAPRGVSSTSALRNPTPRRRRFSRRGRGRRPGRLDRGRGKDAFMLDEVDLLVCGAGPAGCVVAERAATVLGWNVLVVDQRRHVAGNCYDSRHANGVLIHNYGPHYFRTNDAALLKYLSHFTDWLPARYEVKSYVRRPALAVPDQPHDAGAVLRPRVGRGSGGTPARRAARPTRPPRLATPRNTCWAASERTFTRPFTSTIRSSSGGCTRASCRRRYAAASRCA